MIYIHTYTYIYTYIHIHIHIFFVYMERALGCSEIDYHIYFTNIYEYMHTQSLHDIPHSHNACFISWFTRHDKLRKSFAFCFALGSAGQYT
jgi:hypothetical protein